MRLMRVGIAGTAVLLALSQPVLAHGPAKQGAAHSALPAAARGPAATVDAFHAALRRGDMNAAAALLADDALIFEEGGVERSKAEYVVEHLPADAAFSKVVHSMITRRAGGANASFAWVASEGRMTGTHDGKAVNRSTTETMLLRRAGSAWKVIHIHWSSAAASD